MSVEYESKTFDNFEELQEKMPRIAKSLVDEYGEGAWQEDQIFVYPNASEYAKYEISDGWYMDALNSYRDTDWRGAPNPFDYFDYEALGDALTSNWDESSHAMVGDSVVTTSTGW